MVTYKTPGVYIEEISTLPPSVVQVATAIPAFIGYTEKGPADGEVQVKRIDTLLDYETAFGGPPSSAFDVSVDDSTDPPELLSVTRTAPAYEFRLYYSVDLYFKNGGGSCYIVSVGTYDMTPDADHFSNGLAEVEKEDEPTLIVLADAAGLSSDDYYSLGQSALQQCNKLGDRFAVLDVVDTDNDAVQDFRNGIGNNNLMYGAAYYPDLNTTLNDYYTEDQVTITPRLFRNLPDNLEAFREGLPEIWQGIFGTEPDARRGIRVIYTRDSSSGDTNIPTVSIDTSGLATISFTTTADTLTIQTAIPNGSTADEIVTAWDEWVGVPNETHGFEIIRTLLGRNDIISVGMDNVPLKPVIAESTLASIKTSYTALYNQIKARLSQERVTLPPSAAVAGIYASVDRDRGVWKAPANVSLSSVIGPVVKITNAEQEDLNVPDSGKSINAIRSFTGKGTLVWGARTLAGNDNEWKYVSVRRLFNSIEESIQKATSFAVFESNDATTWLKVKAMSESYLYGLWEQGALAGSTPEAAYFVNVGLGKTMTQDDILNGVMIVEIGVAAVRPAEFIVLRFSHKMQEA